MRIANFFNAAEFAARVAGDAIETDQVQAHLLRAGEFGRWLLRSGDGRSDGSTLTLVESIAGRLRRGLVQAAAGPFQLSQSGRGIQRLGDDLLAILFQRVATRATERREVLAPFRDEIGLDLKSLCRRLRRFGRRC